jgi:hypothetical protein
MPAAMAQAVSRRPLTAARRVDAVGFVVDKVALGQVFLRVLRFSPVNRAPNFSKIKKKSSFTHSFTHSLIHSHPGMNNMTVKAAAVQ